MSVCVLLCMSMKLAAVTVAEIVFLFAAQRGTLCYTIDSTAKEIFKEYKHCVQQKVRQIRLNIKEPKPQMSLTRQGDRTDMDCGLCQRPGKEINEQQGSWFIINSKTEDPQPVPIDSTTYRLEQHGRLVIKSTRNEDEGIYICTYNNLVQSAYYLSVTFNSDINRMVSLNGMAPEPAEDQSLHSSNIKIFNKWTEWSKCNRCGELGVRKRIGICTLKKLNYSLETKPVDIQALDLFEELPCQASAVRPLKLNEVIKKWQNEILYEECFTACIEKTDEVYKIDGKPDLPPLVHRETHIVIAGDTIEFTCPEDKFIDRYRSTGVRWVFGSDELDPFLLLNMTGGRIYLDVMDRLAFRITQTTDSGYYSCWQSSWLVAVFHLVCQPAGVFHNTPADIIFFVAVQFAIIAMFIVIVQIWRVRNDRRFS